jgi:tRNA(Ile)-lysidine synthase
MLPLEEHLRDAWPPADWEDVGVVLAVSGGADSVALARAMAALKTGGRGRLTLAHFNHRLRGEASDRDERFVRQLADRLGLECVVGAGESQTRGVFPGNVVPGSVAPGGMEAAARAARYAFLQRTAETWGARYVATAHTADDQAETVLHHVLRGSGLAGLAGMSRTRALGPAVTLIRPLLAIRRHELRDYLASLGQPYCEDATNEDLRFARNRIRHDLLPLVERDYRPAAVEALVRLAALAGDAQRVIENAASKLLDTATVSRNADRVRVSCNALTDSDRHLVREMFVVLWRRQAWPQQDMGYVQWDALAGMALDPLPTAKQVLPGAITAQRQGDELELVAP